MSAEAAFLALCREHGVDPDSIPNRAGRRGFMRRVRRPVPCSPDRARSRDRRRTWGGTSALPPLLRALFTPAEGAVAAVVRDQVKRRRGLCGLSHAEIAALAGVCVTIVKRAMRIMRAAGLVQVQHRRVERDRNLPNVVTIISPEWLAWIAHGRAGRHDDQGGGGTTVPATKNQEAFRKKTSPEKRQAGELRDHEHLDDMALRRWRARLDATWGRRR